MRRLFSVFLECLVGRRRGREVFEQEDSRKKVENEWKRELCVVHYKLKL
jgi:hypothetical protein